MKVFTCLQDQRNRIRRATLQIMTNVDSILEEILLQYHPVPFNIPEVTVVYNFLRCNLLQNSLVRVMNHPWKNFSGSCVM